MRLILVTGSYGSGTTAVTGALVSMGIPSIPPFFESNDPRTVNTYESLAFKELVNLLADQSTLRVDDSKGPEFQDGLKTLLENADTGADESVVLKAPLASVCLQHISRAVETTVIMVHRPLEEVEATRKRRNWHAVYGAAGAQVIYSRLLSDLIGLNQSFLAVSYPALLEKPRVELKRIADFCQLTQGGKNLQKGIDFIRN